jgi:nitroimidazol reductase NimA-like FMN-containing flavoprotein (pyridoxamine 5'-phosphate oxidase superfamily)
MFRTMRRAKQELSREECEAILEAGSNGTLAVLGDDGYAYAVPLSYVYWNGKIVFHCAKKGHKLDALIVNPKVSFCVVGQDEVTPETFATDYTSVIVFGRARVMDDEDEILASIRALGMKYCAEVPVERHEEEIAKDRPILCMVAIEVDHMTGKESRAMAQARRGF